MTTGTPTLFICLQCGSTARDEHGCKVPNPASNQLAEDIATALATHHPEAAAKINIRLTRCLSLCTKPIAWGLRAEGLYNYTFAPATSPQSIAQLAAQWLTAPNGGRVPKKEMPEDLRPTFISRLPPLPEE